MLKKIFTGLALTTLLATGAQAEGKANADEAMVMVKKAVAFIGANGPEKSHATFSDKSGGFVDRDLYIVVYGLDGKVLAHGSNAKLVGKDLSDAQDVDGVYYVRDRIRLAKEQGKFWQDYKFVNPLTKKIEPKRMYCERLGETAVCGGIYKS